MKKYLITLFSSPRYVLNFPFLNKVGLQKIRINSKLNELKNKMDLNLSEFENEAFKQLEENGIVVIPNFLSVEEFSELQLKINEFKTQNKCKNEIGKEGGEIRWQHGNFPIGFSSLIENKFRNNQSLNKIIESYTKRKIHSQPEVIYQSLNVPSGFVDKDDVQTVFHADRHFRTLKIFYTVSDHDATNGAFWYCPKSHDMNANRIKFETEYSVRSALERSGRSEEVDQRLLENGRSVVHPDLLDKYEKKQMCALKNSLIIADVSGFHKRGFISAGQTRETIRIIYHYIHAPVLVQFALKLINKKPGRYLN